MDTFNTGQSIPLKIQIKDINGNFLTQEQVTLLVQKEINPPPPNTVVGLFVYDNVNKQYKIVWQTPSGNPGLGTYKLKYVLNYQSINPAKPESIIPGPASTDGTYTLKVKLLK